MKNLLLFAIIVATFCSCGQRTEELSKRVDSLQMVLTKTTIELNKYKRNPAELLTRIKHEQEINDFSSLKANYDTLVTYHPESSECKVAKRIWDKIVKEKEEAKRKAQEEAELRAQEEAERKAQEEAELRAQEAARHCENCGKRSDHLKKRYYNGRYLRLCDYCDYICESKDFENKCNEALSRLHSNSR